MSERDRADAREETRLPAVDAVETLGLVVVPAVVVGLGTAALGGPDGFVAGAAVGGVAGALFARIRAPLRAVRTDDGVERRLPSTPDGTLWARLAGVKYDERYDRLLAVACLLVGVGAFAAVPLTNVDGPSAVRLAAVGLGGLVCALLVVGASES